MKDLLRNWLFKREIEAYAQERHALEERMRAIVDREDQLDADCDVFEAKKRSLNVVDLVRENLKGFNPRLLDSEDDILAVVMDEGEDSEATFLSKMHDVFENKQLWRLADFIMRDLIIYAVREAEDLKAINFARASLNGVGLLREEVERLNTVYLEKHAKPEAFDEFEAL